MPLGSNTQCFFDRLRRQVLNNPIPPLEEIPISELREMTLAQFAEYGAALPVGAAHHDFLQSEIPLAAGLTLPTLTYTPKNYQRHEHDTVVFLYGGAFVINCLDAHRSGIATLAEQACCKVIAIDYLIAPEFSAKTITESAYAAVDYIFHHADELAVNASNINIMGYSSGGNLAAGIVNRARTDPEIAFKRQILLSPWMDLSFEIHNHNPFVAYQECDQMLTTEALEYSARLYLDGEDPKQPLFSPAFEVSLSGLPPTLVVTSEYDRLRGTVEDYVAKLLKAGVDVNYIVCQEQTHNFFICRKVLNDGDNPADIIAQAIAC